MKRRKKRKMAKRTKKKLLNNASFLILVNGLGGAKSPLSPFSLFVLL